MKLGCSAERARDDDALALAARELVQETLGAVARQADHLQQLAHPVGALAPRMTAGDVDRLTDQNRRPACED